MTSRGQAEKHYSCGSDSGIACGMVVDIDQRGGAIAGFFHFLCRLRHAGKMRMRANIRAYVHKLAWSMRNFESCSATNETYSNYNHKEIVC